MNIAPHNAKLKTFLRDLKPVIDMGPDALIMSDPGLIMMVREAFPQMDIHLSVQANAVNWATVKFWKQMGLTRVILSRELSLEEIAEIRAEVPDMELEIFVHGALCMAYSGRCLLSGYINKRDPNGAPAPTPVAGSIRLKKAKRMTPAISCTCTSRSRCKPSSRRWASAHRPTRCSCCLKRKTGRIYERLRRRARHLYHELQDLRAIQHVERLTQLGVHSLKIEGRTKSFYYCARTAQSTAAPSTTRPPANPSIRPCLPLWKARRTAATPKASYAATCTKRSRITTTAPRSPSASSCRRIHRRAPRWLGRGRREE